MKGANGMAKTVAAIFDNRSNAEKAAQEIKDQGLRTEDISIVAKEKDDKNYSYNENSNEGRMENNNDGRMNFTGKSEVNDNISDGVISGGVLGGLAGLLIGAGSMVVPGLGIVAAAGPITGLISGAVTGGIVGGLIDLGIPEDRGRQYESDIKAGKILFTMNADEKNIDKISSILKENGAISVDTY